MAAALPFVRTGLPIAPLMIGTMAPDVPYFLPVDIARSQTHSLAGVPTVDLAITAVLVLLWYAVLRAPIVDLLPRVFRTRVLRAPRIRRWTDLLIGVAAALVGILTHLAWDSFTHRGWLSDLVPVLGRQIGPLPLTSWLQHTSTVLGLAILAVWVARWVQKTAPDASAPTLATPPTRVVAWAAVWLAFCGTGLAFVAAYAVAGIPPFAPSAVFTAVTSAGAVAGFTGVVVCAIWWIARALRAQTERRTATTFPSTSASSPRIGSNAELRGSSQV